MSSPSRRPVFLFDMTRQRSHLVFRYIGTHPDIQDMWHPFLPATLLGPERLTLRSKNPGRGNNEEWTPPSGENTYAEGALNLLHAVKEAGDQGKLLVANEHSQMVMKQDVLFALLRGEIATIPAWITNPTVIPDHIFTSITPIFVIRNPLFAVPSNYIILRKTSNICPDGGEDWRAITGLPFQRQLFDHFRQRNNGKAPPVVDGDDVVWRTTELRDSLSQVLDLDPKGFSSVWEAVPPEKRHEHPVIRAFLQNIDDSTGIENSGEKRPESNLGQAYDKWVGQYGQEIADQLRSTVETNMPHYEYMAQFKI